MAHKRNCPYTPSRLQEMYEREGLTIEEIADRCQEHFASRRPCHYTVKRWLKESNTPLRTRAETSRSRSKYRLNQQQIEEVTLLYQSGMSSSALAKKFSTTAMTILATLRRENVEIRLPGWSRDSRNSSEFSGERLRYWRTKRNMTQSQLAHAICCEKGAEQIRQWEKGYRTPSADYLIRILAVLKLYATQLAKIQEPNLERIP